MPPKLTVVKSNIRICGMGNCLGRDDNAEGVHSVDAAGGETDRDKRAKAAEARLEASQRRGQVGEQTKLKAARSDQTDLPTDTPLKWSVK